MKLLKVIASGYKNCETDITIDFITKSKKTSEDKEYELQEILNHLYTFNVVGIIGKNASGKTTILELLFVVYSLLDEFRAPYEYVRNNKVHLIIYFSEGNEIYKYDTFLRRKHPLTNSISLTEERIYKKTFYKSRVNTLFDDEGFQLDYEHKDFPDELSMLYYVLKNKVKSNCFYDCNSKMTMSAVFSMFEEIDEKYFSSILKVFDHNIKTLDKIDELHFKMKYNDTEYVLTDEEVVSLLSKGTEKGFVLYLMAIYCLYNGTDLLVDEIENHFHKTLVYNLIDLFKDKNVNKKKARIIFSTHYCEILDTFNRSDNIWITKCDDKITLINMYEKYPQRSDLLKSKKFYMNAFDTAVDYDALMALKKELSDDKEINPM